MEKKVNQELNYKLAVTGVFGALSIVLSLTHLGFISLGGLLTITIMHIPTILVTIMAGLVPGLGVGLIFGISSLINTATGGAANPFFLNPCVSIVPRLLIPVVTYFIYKALNCIFKMPKVISGSISAAFGTLTNTVFVMLAIYIFYGKDLVAGMSGALTKIGFDVSNLSAVKGYFAILACTLLTNGIWEIIGAVVICAAVLSSMYLVKNRKSKIHQMEEDESNR